jgi:hypothetical protein
MIHKVRANSKITEVSSVADLLIKAYQASGITADTHLVGIFDELTLKSAALTGAIRQIKAQSQMEAVDQLLDNALRGLFFTTQGALYSDDAVVNDAAQKVDAVLKTFGMSIIEENYATESALVKSMLNALANTEVAEAVLLVPGLTAVIAQVQTALDAFQAAAADYKQKKSVDSNEKTATAIKVEILILLNDKLVRYLDGMWAVDEAAYGAVARNVAQIIDDSNLMVKMRGNDLVPGE